MAEFLLVLLICVFLLLSAGHIALALIVLIAGVAVMATVPGKKEKVIIKKVEEKPTEISAQGKWYPDLSFWKDTAKSLGETLGDVGKTFLGVDKAISLWQSKVVNKVYKALGLEEKKSDYIDRWAGIGKGVVREWSKQYLVNLLNELLQRRQQLVQMRDEAARAGRQDEVDRLNQAIEQIDQQIQQILQKLSE